MAKKDNTNLIIGLVAVGLLVVGVALYLSKHHSNGGDSGGKGVCCPDGTGVLSSSVCASYDKGGCPTDGCVFKAGVDACTGS